MAQFEFRLAARRGADKLPPMGQRFWCCFLIPQNLKVLKELNPHWYLVRLPTEEPLL
jgi:hypothetical protein